MPQAKLVRDKIPQIMRTKGIEPEVRVLGDIEFGEYALAKLVEESQEAAAARYAHHERLVEELADVAEVFDAICGHFSITPAELLAAREKKRREKGGFERRLLLIPARQEK
jgi:predicted house-cleaning noncanonical NTP pyrophosphatase (MazG superfamily)